MSTSQNTDWDSGHKSLKRKIDDRWAPVQDGDMEYEPASHHWSPAAMDEEDSTEASSGTVEDDWNTSPFGTGHREEEDDHAMDVDESWITADGLEVIIEEQDSTYPGPGDSGIFASMGERNDDFIVLDWDQLAQTDMDLDGEGTENPPPTKKQKLEAADSASPKVPEIETSQQAPRRGRPRNIKPWMMWKPATPWPAFLLNYPLPVPYAMMLLPESTMGTFSRRASTSTPYVPSRLCRCVNANSD